MQLNSALAAPHLHIEREPRQGRNALDGAFLGMELLM